MGSALRMRPRVPRARVCACARARTCARARDARPRGRARLGQSKTPLKHGAGHAAEGLPTTHANGARSWYAPDVPIRPENRGRYPKNWPEISRWVRVERAGNRCECRGECGEEHREAPDHRCVAVEGAPHPRARRRALELLEVPPSPRSAKRTKPKGLVRLTVGHVNHRPEDNDGSSGPSPDPARSNLRAWCERCHLGHDRQHHLRNRRINRARALRKAGQQEWPWARQLTIAGRSSS